MILSIFLKKDCLHYSNHCVMIILQEQLQWSWRRSRYQPWCRTRLCLMSSSTASIVSTTQRRTVWFSSGTSMARPSFSGYHPQNQRYETKISLQISNVFTDMKCLYRHQMSLQTSNVFTDIKCLYRHQGSTDTQSLYRHPTSLQTSNVSTDIKCLYQRVSNQ